MNKPLVIGLIAIIILVGGVYYFTRADQAGDGVSNSSTAGLSSAETSESFGILNMNIEILREGTGKEAKAGDRATVNYVGSFEDGTKFDSSVDRGQPFTFILAEGSVIQGWELGVEGMKAGEKRRLTIPPELAYGEQGAGGVIPPNATLIFEIDMLAVNP